MSDEPMYKVTEKLPAIGETVRVWRSDGSKTHATWTGAVWWRGEEIAAVKWQRMTPAIEHGHLHGRVGD